jgi:hypothetical protein
VGFLRRPGGSLASFCFFAWSCLALPSSRDPLVHSFDGARERAGELRSAAVRVRKASSLKMG